MDASKMKVRLITAGLLLGLVLSSLEQTVVSTAMPAIVKELGGLSLYSWVFTLYMLTSTVTMPIYGKLADLFGRKKVYLVGLSLFLGGSALCGFAGSMLELILYRGIQGLGAGALMPVAFTIIADLFPPEKRARFMGVFSAVFTLSSILGPTVGGFLVEYGDWSFIFFLNLPIGIPAFFLIAYALQESMAMEKRRVDWIGAVTFTAAVVSILLALVMGGEQHQGEINQGGWGSPLVVALFSTGLLLLALFVWIENKVTEPMIPLHLFRIRTLLFSNLTGFFASGALFGGIAYIPLFVQAVIGVSPSMAGYSLTPLMLASVVTSTISGRLMKKLSYRAILIVSLALMTAGFFLLSRMTAATSIGEMILLMAITGLGMGAIFPTVGTAAQNAVDMRNRGVATSTNQFFRSIGGTIGVSILGSLFAERLAAGISRIRMNIPEEHWQQVSDPQVLLQPETRASMPQEMVQALQYVFSDALSIVFALGMGFVLVSLVTSTFMGQARLVEAAKS
ncbi:MDR family MFS transporter [Brevibacillus migulae]|uniref:MDR family MFS transporter n=1 Tax=Brevibacillus migulae TaxID=1644114 RepID=UPI00106EA535|nr:MDR family MFS transporter [Brevibacillus migulae]